MQYISGENDQQFVSSVCLKKCGTESQKIFHILVTSYKLKKCNLMQKLNLCDRTLPKTSSHIFSIQLPASIIHPKILV